jgi:hypothetical protein
MDPRLSSKNYNYSDDDDDGYLDSLFEPTVKINVSGSGTYITSSTALETLDSMKRKQSGKPKLQKTASLRVLEEQRMLDTLKSKVNDNTLKSKVDDNTLKSKVDDNTLKSKVDDNILKNQNDGNDKVSSIMNLKIKTRIKDGIAPMLPSEFKISTEITEKEGRTPPIVTKQKRSSISSSSRSIINQSSRKRRHLTPIFIDLTKDDTETEIEEKEEDTEDEDNEEEEDEIECWVMENGKRTRV